MQKVKERLVKDFGEKVREQGNFLKVNKSELDEIDLFILNDIRQLEPTKSIRVRRSGTGIVIIVEIN